MVGAKHSNFHYTEIITFLKQRQIIEISYDNDGIEMNNIPVTLLNSSGKGKKKVPKTFIFFREPTYFFRLVSCYKFYNTKYV